MNKSIQKIIFSIVGIFFLCILFFIVHFIANQFKTNQNIDSPLDMIYNPVVARRYLIEKECPEFKDFEKQKSFAGQSVKSVVVDFDYYFAYIIHGSGLPIVQATCFRVDRSGRVFKVGLFPDYLDSYAGYASVNPVNCKGIK